MITVITGKTIIKGNIAELTQDFCSILDALISETPEIVVACETEYSEDVLATLSKADPHKAELVRIIASQFKTFNKENK